MSVMKEAVCVLIRRKDGRLLFIQRAAGKFASGYWTPVTGRLEAGEALPEAARREVREETGLECVVGRELGRTKVDAPPGQEAPPFELVWFEAVPTTERLALDAAEVAQARWVTLEEALALEPMFPTTRSFLRAHAS
jgi:8-oxo-dGTP pyrophosphatase MutT (NUDIX family)